MADEMPGVSIFLSHRIGPTGLLQRKSAAILNGSLHKLGRQRIAAFRAAFTGLGLACPLYLTQNDSTLKAADYAERFPASTMSSGPTNSMRGSAFLTGLKGAAVIDVGGTTTDVSLRVRDFPRSRSEIAMIADVRTNFRVPDVFSFGLGAAR